MRFSERARWDLTPNALSLAVARRRARAVPFDDLTESNPTRVGLSPAWGELYAPLASEPVAAYDPDPRGLAVAREAVGAYYRARGHDVDPSRVVLTASTSEAYGWLFKLLCDPGDEALVARPSYPLFDDLARLEQVSLRPFALDYHGRWEVDVDSLRGALTPRSRAVMLVHPNNPTGSFVSREALAAVASLCRERSLALVVDEVFLDHAWGDDPARAPSAVTVGEALTFTLSGLSKVAALPQLKLGWVVVGGPDALRCEALERLEMIADCYLSVGAPVQHAAPSLLARSGEVTARVLARVRANRAALAAACAGSSVTPLGAEGGWNSVLRVPRTRADEELALALLEERAVLVQPGWLYDFPGEGYLVLSLLPREEAFAPAVERLVGYVDAG